jgi:hypothetical protein
MSTITIRKDQEGNKTYRVAIRRKGIEIFKTFRNKQDAELYSFYKERLIDNMKAFEVTIKDTITFEQAMEMKKSQIPQHNTRELNDLDNTTTRILPYLKANEPLSNISFERWVDIAKSLLSTSVYRGAKTENGKRELSVATLRKIFAHVSSAVSYAISQGISLENIPLKVIQCYISPLIKKE